MAQKLFIYLVSADESFIAQHKERLTREADINVFRTVAECRNGLAAHRPDLVIIDTSLPEDTGFLLHRELRDDFDLSDLFQLLLCSHEDVSREGFDADDLLIRPVNDAVFWHKLENVRKAFEAKSAAREQMAYAQSVAFTSMSAMGELGVVMQFLSKSFTCHNIQSVGSLAIESLRQYELEGVAYMIWEGDSIALTTEAGDVPKAQRDLVEQRRTLGRILEIERNLIVNYDHVSLLVTNLPEDDPQRLGRIRDNIATLAEGVESRIQGLLLEHDNILKQQGIRFAAGEIRDSVKNLDARQMADLEHTSALVNQVIDEFEDAFLHMGLHASHENILIGNLVALRQKVGEIVGHPGEVHDKLRIVIAALETMAGEVQAD